MVQSKKHVMPLYCDSTFEHLQGSFHIDPYGFFHCWIHWKRVWFIWYHSSSSSLSISGSRIGFLLVQKSGITQKQQYFHPLLFLSSLVTALEQVNQRHCGVYIFKSCLHPVLGNCCRLLCSVIGVGLKDLHRSIPTPNIQWYCGSLLLLYSTSICSFSQGYRQYRGQVHLLCFGVLHGLKH